MRITLDTKPLRSNLPALPTDDFVNGLPPFPGQANLFKGLLLSLNTIAPKMVLHVGYAEVSAATISLADLGGGAGAVPAAGGGAAPGVAGLPGLDELPPGSSVDDGLNSAAPVAKGMPPLGSLPMILLLGGLALASGAAWYLRRAGLLLFGGANACSFGLKAGIPDLRKA